MATGMLWIIGLLALLGAGLWAVRTGLRKRDAGGVTLVAAGMLVLAGAGWMAWLGWREADPSQLVGRLLACAAFFLLGLLIVLLGFRGWRVGTLPHCRACGFNLFGKPDSSTRCSECGADVTQTGAITVGNHRFRHDRILYGTIICCIALCVASSHARRIPVEDVLFAADTALYRLKSDRQLVHDLVTGRLQSNRPTVMRKELDRRLADASRAPALYRKLCDEILRRFRTTRQSVTDFPWLLLQRQAMEQLTDSEIAELLDAMMQVGLTAPKLTGRGLPLELRFWVSPRVRFWEIQGVEAELEWLELRVGPVSDAPLPTTDPNNRGRLLAELGDHWNLVPDGLTVVEARVRLRVRLGAGPGRSVDAVVERSIQAFTTVVDPTGVVPPLATPTQADREITWHVELAPGFGDSTLSLRLTPSSVPSERIASRVDLRQGGVTVPLTYIALSNRHNPDRGDPLVSIHISRDQLKPGPFELVFSPDPRAVNSFSSIDVSPILDLPFSVTVDLNQP